MSAACPSAMPGARAAEPPGRREPDRRGVQPPDDPPPRARGRLRPEPGCCLAARQALAHRRRLGQDGARRGACHGKGARRARADRGRQAAEGGRRAAPGHLIDAVAAATEGKVQHAGPRHLCQQPARRGAAPCRCRRRHGQVRPARFSAATSWPGWRARRSASRPAGPPGGKGTTRRGGRPGHGASARAGPGMRAGSASAARHAVHRRHLPPRPRELPPRSPDPRSFLPHRGTAGKPCRDPGGPVARRGVPPGTLRRRPGRRSGARRWIS